MPHWVFTPMSIVLTRVIPRMSNPKPCMWNYFAHSGPRTNNDLEEWHNRLKKKVHPIFYEVLEVFQKEQPPAEVTIVQLQALRQKDYTKLKDKR